MPNSPISLRLTSTSRQFAFFCLAFNLYDSLLQSGVFDSTASKVNVSVYLQLRSMFMVAKNEHIVRISLSETHINILSNCVAELLRVLPENDLSDQSKNTLSLLTEALDNKFLENARDIFNKHRERFKHVPEFRKTLDLLSK